MALPKSPSSAPEPKKSNEFGLTTQSSMPPIPKRLPVKPVKSDVENGTHNPLIPSLAPPSAGEDISLERGRYLDDDAEVLRAEEEQRRKHIGTGQELGLGDQSKVLTAQNLIDNNYQDYYARLEPKIVEVKEWLQNLLTERGRSEDIAEARSQRGAKYQEMKVLIDQLLIGYFNQSNVVSHRDGPIVTSMVTNELLGFGPIEPLWLDNTISEIMVNGPFRIRIERGGKLIDVPGARFRNKEHLLEVSQQMLAPLGRTIDIANPLEDGRLPDGSRINVTHPVVGPKGPFLTIRRFPDTVFSVRKLVEMESMTEEMAVEIGNLIAAGCSMVIVGGTGSGKTSMLNALSGCIPGGERIITIEDNLELQLHPDRDVISMEARKSHQGDKGAVTIRDLVRNSLRQRPDRIIVGEVRDGSAYDMLQAMNTGHDGSMTTVHANDALGGVDRLINLMNEAENLETSRALSLIAGGIDIMVIIDRYPEDGSRRVAAIAEIPSRVTIQDGSPMLDPITLFEFVQTDLIQDDNNNDKILGEYRKVNDISKSLIRKHRLDKRRRLTLEEIYQLSEQGKIVD